jgi:hypothetical protein
MRIDVKLQGFDTVEKELRAIGRFGFNQAAAAALNDAAFAVRRAYQADMRKVFDRPTPYVISSVRVTRAQPDRLIAEVEPRYQGGKGVEPGKVLAAHIEGGRRRNKRSEVALERAGILPAGYQTAIPREPYPGSDDGRGNLRGPFIVQLLSYFAAFSEQGYRANMTKRRRDRLANITTSAAGVRTISGVQYFVVYGRLRPGRRGDHLAPGIWARTGAQGMNIRPVLLFVKRGTYTERLDLDSIAQAGDLQAQVEKRLRFRIRQTFERGAA